MSFTSGEPNQHDLARGIVALAEILLDLSNELSLHPAQRVKLEKLILHMTNRKESTE